MSSLRRCSRPGCGKPAVATLTYAYLDSTAVVGPLATVQEPHSWDLCSHHADKITVPIGWEMVRVDDISIDDIAAEDLEEEDLLALAEAVREGGRYTTGLVDADNAGKADPIDFPPYQSDPVDPETSLHPVFRSKRVAEVKQTRRAHLSIVPDPPESTD